MHIYTYKYTHTLFHYALPCFTQITQWSAGPIPGVVQTTLSAWCFRKLLLKKAQEQPGIRRCESVWVVGTLGFGLSHRVNGFPSLWRSCKIPRLSSKRPTINLFRVFFFRWMEGLDQSWNLRVNWGGQLHPVDDPISRKTNPRHPVILRCDVFLGMFLGSKYRTSGGGPGCLG